MEGHMESSIHSLPLPLSQIVWKDDSLLDHDSEDCLPTTKMGTPLCSSLCPAKQAPSWGLSCQTYNILETKIETKTGMSVALC